MIQFGFSRLFWAYGKKRYGITEETKNVPTNDHGPCPMAVGMDAGMEGKEPDAQRKETFS